MEDNSEYHFKINGILLTNHYVISGDARSVDRFPLTSPVDTSLIPEFPSIIIMLFFMTGTILVLELKKEFHQEILTK